MLQHPHGRSRAHRSATGAGECGGHRHLPCLPQEVPANPVVVHRWPILRRLRLVAMNLAAEEDLFAVISVPQRLADELILLK